MLCAENACVVLCEGYTDPEVIKRPASQKEDIELEVPLLTLQGSGLAGRQEPRSRYSLSASVCSRRYSDQTLSTANPRHLSGNSGFGTAELRTIHCRDARSKVDG